MINKPIPVTDITPPELFAHNYQKFLRLFPQFNPDAQQFTPLCPGMYINNDHARLGVMVEELHKYTNIVSLQYGFDTNNQENHQQAFAKKLGLSILCMRLYLYHDARLLEVTQFQQSKKLKKFLVYPNKNMYHLDEKKQLNFHLQTILDMALQCYYKHKQLDFNLG